MCQNQRLINPPSNRLAVDVPAMIVHTVGISRFPSSVVSELKTNSFTSGVSGWKLSIGVSHMNVDLNLMKNLISKRGDEIEKSVAGTGYLAKTVIGVGTFLLDNEGDYELLTANQKVVFDKFLKPLLDKPRR